MSFPNRSEILSDILHTLRDAGGDLHGHLVLELEGQMVGLFLCANPKKGLLALRSAGLEPELESVVVAETENRWGALSHLLRTIESEGIHVGYSYSSSATASLCVVLRTSDNDRARAALERYLVLPETDEDGQD